MSYVETARRGRVLEVTLNKPKVNAIDIEMSRDMGRAFAELREDPDLWCAILTGAGEKIFSAGWDLKALNSGDMALDNWWEEDYGDGGFAGLTENWRLNKPVICALNGLAIGGGFEIALACDLIIAADHVEFGLPEMPLGIVPDAGALQRLPRRIPHNIAMEMFLLGRRMGATEAAHYGLINKVVPREKLMDAAREWADQIAWSAPLAMQAVKEVE
ncbi:MAG: enoyl-CoA hydratase-related protein, partial [Albidovulum sp.]